MLADAQFKPNLIILDLNIPKVSGLGLLERGDMTGIPVVVFTSSSNPTEKERCLALGVREVVLKPMDLGEFSETVCRIVRTWAIPEATCAGS
jgi:CheY-like chemotaxis protein